MTYKRLTIRHLKEITAFSEMPKLIQGNSTNTTLKNYNHSMYGKKVTNLRFEYENPQRFHLFWNVQANSESKFENDSFEKVMSF